MDLYGTLFMVCVQYTVMMQRPPAGGGFNDSNLNWYLLPECVAVRKPLPR